MLGEQEDVLPPLAQGRHHQVEHVEAVIEVFAKAALPHHALQVAVSSAEHPHVHLHLAVATDAAEAAIAEKTQQLGLQVGRHLAHLVEEHRAAIGQLQQARLAAALGAGEGARRIAEQLALGQALRQRRAVQREERRISPRAQGVAGARHQFLAGSGFAQDQQRRIQAGHLLQARLELIKGRRLADQCLQAFGVVVVQGGQAFADAARRIERQQPAGKEAPAIRTAADGRSVQQQGLALETHLAHRQAEALVDQRLPQVCLGEQLRQRFAGRIAPAQADQRGVGQQHMAARVHRQHRVAHGRQQRIQLHSPVLAGQQVHQLHGLHAVHSQQGVVEFVQHALGQGRRVDVDVGRDHLHRVQVEVARAEQRQDFLGDADAVDEGDVDSHGGSRCGQFCAAMARAQCSSSSRKARRISGGATPRRVMVSKAESNCRRPGSRCSMSPSFTHCRA
ncbi:hypothetical protein D3C85_912620 [compost metagenome]